MPTAKKRLFDIVTIFPDMIGGYANASMLGRAQKDGKIEIRAQDLRQWALDKHRTTDDSPYGGGAGMLMKVEPFDLAVKAIKLKGKKQARVIMTAASGKPFTQGDAKRLAKYDQLIFLCGRYEGIDERVREHIADECFSIGNYVLTGGELPALVMTDAIARNVPGVLGAKESLAEESHGTEGWLEYPQYTKPAEYNGWTVPEALMSGNHAAIAAWRESHRGPSQST